MAVKIFKAKMQKGAAGYLMSLPNDVQNDLYLLRDAFRARYHHPALTDRHQTEFCSRKQRKGESLVELAEYMRRMVRKAYPTIKDSEALDQLAKNQFVDAVWDDELRKDVRTFRKATLDETLNEAIRLENAIAVTSRERREKENFGIEDLLLFIPTIQ